MEYIYKKNPTAKLCYCVALRALQLRLGTSQVCPFSPFIFNTVLNLLANAMKQEKGIKGTKMGKSE